MLDELRVWPSFTDFEKEVLCWLRVALSQLHPNSWAFVRAFEIVMKVFFRPCSTNLFFTIFEAVWQPVKGEDGASRYRWVSLRKRRGLKLFYAYFESVKEFNDNFMYVIPVNRAALEKVVCSYETSKIDATKFHFECSYDHFCLKLAHRVLV